MWQNYGHEWPWNHFSWPNFIPQKNESLTSAKIQNTSTNIDLGTVDKLQIKIKLLETINKLLKDDIKNKQKLIDSILEHNITNITTI